MERIGGAEPEMRLQGSPVAVGGDAGCLVWRLRLGLATLAPGGLGLTVRPYYEGLPIDRLDEGRMNGGESCRDRGKRKASPSGHGRTVPRPKIATVERREARRPASSAGGLRRSGDRPDREASHGCGASAPAPVGAPPRF